MDVVKVPVTVVIGLQDTEPLSDKPQQAGWTRIDRARHYVKRVQQTAEYHNRVSRINLLAVSGVGHNSAKLTPASMNSLARMLQDESTEEKKDGAGIKR